MVIETGRPGMALELRSLVRANGELELSLVGVATPAPKPDEVVVRVEASPINPSDIGLLFGAADMSTARQSGTAANPVITASIPEGPMRSMAGRVDQSMPVGNEGAGVVVDAGSSAAAQALLGRTVAHLRRRDVFAVPLHQGRAMPGPARRHDPRRGGLVLRQSAHVAGHGRDHAAGRPHRAGAHRGGFQSGPDAQPHLHRGQRRPGEHRAHAAAGGSSAGDRCAPCVQLQRPDVHPGPHRGPGRDRRDHRLRRHRRRQAGRTDTDLHGSGAEPVGERVQPVRLRDPQAGLHLRGARHRPDRAQPQLRLCLGCRRLAAVAVPAEDRTRGGAEAARAGRRRVEDDVRQPLHQRGLARRGPAAGGNQRVRQARHRAPST